MTLHLVRLVPEAKHLARLAHLAGLPEHDQGYLFHHALRQAFGGIAPQPFRVFEPDPDAQDDKPLHLLGYATADEAALLGARAEASAEAAAVFPADGIAAKPLPEAFAAGRTLAFSTRICPIVRTRSSDSGKKRELDAFVHVAAADPDAPKPDRADIYRDWLRRLLKAGGAELLDARLASFRLTSLVRRSHASPNGRTATEEGRPKRLPGRRPRSAARRPDAVLDGLLRIAEPDRFQQLLAKGIGRHRAFGFGLLLLRPAG